MAHSQSKALAFEKGENIALVVFLLNFISQEKQFCNQQFCYQWMTFIAVLNVL